MSYQPAIDGGIELVKVVKQATDRFHNIESLRRPYIRKKRNKQIERQGNNTPSVAQSHLRNSGSKKAQ
ncbi:hypothetical protein GCM10028773_21580 [Spirosoma koreense]